MRVFVGRSRTPIVIETNVAWALPYWVARKHLNPDIRWEFT